MNRQLHTALAKFEETLIGMSGRTRIPNRADWMGTEADDRERCAVAFEAVRREWTEDPAILERLDASLEKCLSAFAEGRRHEGDLRVMEIEQVFDELR